MNTATPIKNTPTATTTTPNPIPTTPNNATSSSSSSQRQIPIVCPGHTRPLAELQVRISIGSSFKINELLLDLVNLLLL